MARQDPSDLSGVQALFFGRLADRRKNDEVAHTPMPTGQASAWLRSCSDGKEAADVKDTLTAEPETVT